MSRKLLQAQLTLEQKARICGILSSGCDRETAANYAGCSTVDIARAMELDPAWAADVRRTEAGSEFSIMRVVQKAAEDTKNWRAGVWWLEMHAPDRFKPRSVGHVTARQLEEFVNVLAAIICDEVESDEDRHRVISRMQKTVCQLDELAR